MLSTLRDAWRIEEIRKKMIFTLIMMLFIRLGSAIPVPYMDRAAIQALFTEGQDTILGFIDMMSGGNFRNFSVFAASIYPYITASIVIQLLTFAIPSLEELAQQGAEGQKKIQNYTKYLAVVLTFITAYGYTNGVFRRALTATTTMQNIVVIFSVVGGTAFLIWIGDKITEKGIGNGISLIIFLGIVGDLPSSIGTMVVGVREGYLSLISVLLFVVFAVLVVAIVVALNEGERRIPVQYAKRVVGRRQYGGQATHIPIKVSMSGVMPVIFANSIMSIPGMFALFNPDSGFANFLANWFTPGRTVWGTLIYSILNILLIVAFSFFYTMMQFNTVEYAQNLQQNGGFIPGIRPGRPTSEYLSRVVNRLVIVGAVILAFLATMPTFINYYTRIPIAFGGTSIIIVVGVVIETVKSIEQQMLLRHYRGFLN